MVCFKPKSFCSTIPKGHKMSHKGIKLQKRQTYKHEQARDFDSSLLESMEGDGLQY
jgi:hypothetical protein